MNKLLILMFSLLIVNNANAATIAITPNTGWITA